MSYVSRDFDNNLVISTGRGSPPLSLPLDLTIEFILAGDIHFWDRKNGKPAHRFHVDGNSFLSAWFPGTGVPRDIKFATGNASGISIWQFGGRAAEFEPEKSPPASV